jgi:hypothetical protein
VIKRDQLDPNTAQTPECTAGRHKTRESAQLWAGPSRPSNAKTGAHTRPAQA